MSEPNTSCLSTALAVATLALLAAAGCVSSPEPTETARSTLQTAPADLQLLCANAVATQTGTASDKVLPLSSRQVNGTSYQVELDAAGTRHSCTVDNDGNVTSVNAG
jgi:hypothetical protein